MFISKLFESTGLSLQVHEFSKSQRYLELKEGKSCYLFAENCNTEFHFDIEYIECFCNLPALLLMDIL